MFKNKKFSGFTLIELMIVIAIIGMLAAIIAVGLGRARDSAKDAKIKSDIAQAATIAELIKDNNNDGYTNLCDSGTNKLDISQADYSLDVVQTDLDNQGATTTCYSNTSSYCLVAQMNNAKWFCRDGTGRAADNVTGTSPCTGAGDTCP